MSGSSTASVQPWTIPPVLQSSSNPIWQKPGPSTILAATSSVGTVFGTPLFHESKKKSKITEKKVNIYLELRKKIIHNKSE
jgi:hypothetical protein